MYANGELSSFGVKYKTLYRMLFKIRLLIECNIVQLKSDTEKLKLRHERMGDVNIRTVKNTCQNFNIYDPKANKVDFFVKRALWENNHVSHIIFLKMRSSLNQVKNS